MSQPPYPPPGGSDPQGQQPNSQGWGQQPGPGGQPEEPTQQFGQPAPFQPDEYGRSGGGREQTAQFGQPPFGQPPYGQPQYGGPVPPGGYGPGGPGGPGGSSGGSGKLIAIIVAVVVVLAGAGVGLFFLLKDDDDASTAAAAATAGTTGSPAPGTDGGSPPTGSPSTGSSSADCEEPSGGSSGVPDPQSPCDITEDDPEGMFLPLAIDCADEDWASCDDLYWATEVGSDWEAYGSTCAGRNEETSGGCVSRYEGDATDDPGGPGSNLPAAGPAPTGAPAEIQPFIDACHDGEMFGCDALRGAQDAAGFEEIYQYGVTCGARNPVTDQYCLELYPGN